MPANDDRGFVMRHFFLQQFDFGVCVESEMIDRDDARQPVMVPDVVDMAFQIGNAFCQSVEVFRIEFLQIDAPMIFEGADGRDNHHDLRAKAGFAAFDVDEFFGTEIGANPASVTT